MQRKASLEEDRRRQELECQRRERERQDNLAQARIDRLMDEAASLRRGADIRAYAVEQDIEGAGIVAPRVEIARWAQWARAQADTIDPLKNGAFLQRFEGDDSSEE